MPETYENIICQYGDDAKATLALLEQRGEHATLEHLRQWHKPGEGTLASSRVAPWKNSDKTFREGDYVLYYDRAAGYVGLACEIDFRRPPR